MWLRRVCGFGASLAWKTSFGGLSKVTVERLTLCQFDYWNKEWMFSLYHLLEGHSAACAGGSYTAEVFWEWIPSWREKCHDFTRFFFRNDSDLSKRQVFLQLCKQVPHKLYICGSKNLSAVHYCIINVAPTLTQSHTLAMSPDKPTTFCYVPWQT